MTGGTVDCWGWANYGMLGNGSNTDQSVPVAVSSLIRRDRHLFQRQCLQHVRARDRRHRPLLGLQRFGQLGNSSNTDSDTPVEVTGL